MCILWENKKYHMKNANHAYMECQNYYMKLVEAWLFLFTTVYKIFYSFSHFFAIFL